MTAEGHAEKVRRDVGVEIFERVAARRMSADIVEQVRARIRAGELRPGDRLPSERDLATQLGVSRVTVRDAFRALESAGLVAIRVGANGGAAITEPSGARLGERIGDMVLIDALHAVEVTEARSILELAMVDLVCSRATAEDLDALEEICARAEHAAEHDRYLPELSTAFHLRLAACAHNRALDVLVGSLRGALRRSLASARGGATTKSPTGLREHREIVAAVSARDASATRAVLAPHLRRTAERLRAAGAASGDGDAALTPSHLTPPPPDAAAP